ncbi:MAG: CheR family methyltransferase [Candidatus Methanoperedens sp.]
MTSGISETLLSELSEFVATRMGLHFPEERWRDLENGVSSAAAEFGFKDAETCIKWLVSSQLMKQELEILASHLTIGETYFFREKKSFEVLEEHILPGFIRSRVGNEKCLRIWSAGCATGEEPYSIMILLSRMIPDIKDWNITILATDINPRFLKKAQKGLYSEWSFRDVPAWTKNYFNKTKHGFEIIPDIRKMVTFSYHNLAEDAYPSLLNNTSAMDIIFCRNVLMYFSEERAKQVVAALYLCLVDGGWLVVSPVETSHVLYSQYVAVNFPGAIYYKKVIARSQRIEEFIPEKIYRPPEEIRVAPLPVEHIPIPEIQSPEEKIKTAIEEQKSAEPDEYKEALMLYQQGMYAQAVDKLIDLASQDHDTKAMVLLARAYANYGKSVPALEWCEKAIAIDRLNPGCHYLYAMILQERGQVEEAVKSLQRALYLDQDFVLAHFALGNLSKQRGKMKESDRYFENALALLGKFKNDEILPESEGITAGRLSEIITSIKGKVMLV